MLSATLRKAASKFFGNPRRRPIRKRLRLQSLEGRDVPSSYYGSGHGDSLAGAQRDLLQNATDSSGAANHIDSLIKLEHHVDTHSSLTIEVTNTNGATNTGGSKNRLFELMDFGDRTLNGPNQPGGRGMKINSEFEATTMTQLKSSFDADIDALHGGGSIQIDGQFEATTMTHLKSSFDADIQGRRGDGSIKIDSDFEMTTMTQLKSSFEADIDALHGGGSTQIDGQFEATTMTHLKSSFDADIQGRHDGGGIKIDRQFEATTKMQLKSSYDVDSHGHDGGGSIKISGEFEMTTMTQLKSSFDADIQGHQGGSGIKVSREFEATTMTHLKSSFDTDIHVRDGGERIKIGGQIESTIMTHLNSTIAAVGTSQNEDQQNRDFLGLGQWGDNTDLSDFFASRPAMDAGSDGDSRGAEQQWFGHNREEQGAIYVGADENR